MSSQVDRWKASMDGIFSDMQSQQPGSFNATTPVGQTSPYAVNPYNDFMKGMYNPGANNLGGGGGITDPSLWQKLTGYTDANGMQNMGYGTAGVGLLQAGIGAYTGLKQLGLAEDSLNFQKDSFSKQFDVQKGLTNEQLRSQHATRVAANPGYWSDKTPLQV